MKIMTGILHCSWYAVGKNSPGLLIWIETLPEFDLDEKVSNQENFDKKKFHKHPYQASGEQIMEFLIQLFDQDDPESSLKKNMTLSELEVVLPSTRFFPYPSLNMLNLINLEREEPLDLEFTQIKFAKWIVSCCIISPEILFSLFDNFVLYSSNSSSTVVFGDDIRYVFSVESFFEKLYAAQSFLPSVDHSNRFYQSSLMALPTAMNNNESLNEWNFLVQKIPTMWIAFNDGLQDIKNDSKEVYLLKNFLEQLLNVKIREKLQKKSKIISKLSQTNKKSAALKNKFISSWINSFISSSKIPEELNQVSNDIYDFMNQSSNKFDFYQLQTTKMCFKLEPPSENLSSWKLSYLLQSVNDPSLLIPARDIWKTKDSTLNYLNKKFENPQEFLLLSLGKASKVYTLIKDSLKEKIPECSILTTNQAYDFLNTKALLLKSLGFGVIVPFNSKTEHSIYHPSVKISITTTSQHFLNSNDLLNFKWNIAIGDDLLTPDEISLLAKLKEPLIFHKGKWIELDSAVLQKTIDYWSKIQKSGYLTIKDLFKLNSNINDDKESLLTNELDLPEWLNETFFSKQKISIPEIPQSFNGMLRPYQLNGVSWLYFMLQIGLNPCLADDMGLGKTIQVIATILILKNNKDHLSSSRPAIKHTKEAIASNKRTKNNRAKKSTNELLILIIAPTSVLHNWGKELNKFSPSITWNIYHGANRSEIELKSSEIVLTSFSISRRDVNILKNIHWDLIVVDEAQNIKNPFSKQAQALRMLKSTHKIILTGTPIENRLLELWSLLDYIEPQYLGDMNYFKKRFIIPIERYHQQHSLDSLKNLIKPFILRRVKTDKSIISDLPDKIETKEYCFLTKEQATLYQSILNSQLLAINQSTGIKRRGNMLATLLKLKQTCNHPVNLLSDNSKIEDRSGKLQRLWELIQEIIETEESMLIFTQFVEMGTILKKFLQVKLFQEVPFLHGGLSIKKREEIIKNFSENENSCPVLIISLKAGGTGLNLTKASHVFHYDRWWNPAVENQATDRAYRIGQLKNVQVHKFITKGTLEERIDELIESKIALAENIIDTGEDWLTSLSTEDFKELISLSQDQYDLGDQYESAA